MTAAAPKRKKKATPAVEKAVGLPRLPEASRIIGGTADDLLRTAHDDTTSWLKNDWRMRGHGRCFLLGRGWSASPDRLKLLREQGWLTAAINNYDRSFTPDIWVTGDPPNYFGRWIWENHRVQKFIPLETADMPCPKEDVDSATKTPKDYPNVHFYHHVTNIDAKNFFITPYAAWGTTSYGPDDEARPHGGVRSSMIAALRILYHLGIRTVNLLGCDFTPHDHPDEHYFADLQTQLAELRPVFDQNEFQVNQCNPDSHLRCFDIVNFEEAVNGPR